MTFLTSPDIGGDVVSQVVNRPPNCHKSLIIKKIGRERLFTERMEAKAEAKAKGVREKDKEKTEEVKE